MEFPSYCYHWSLAILISITFLWELECRKLTKVGLFAGLYSGNSLPDLYLTPHALQSVFGPSGPALHCGVLCARQWAHLLGCCCPLLLSTTFKLSLPPPLPAAAPAFPWSDLDSSRTSVSMPVLLLSSFLGMMSSLSASQYVCWSKGGSELEKLWRAWLVEHQLVNGFLVLSPESLLLLLLDFPGITGFFNGDGCSWSWGFCFQVFGGVSSVFGFWASTVGGGRQFPVLDKQSSTNTDSHSKLKSTSYICFWIHQS